MGSFAVVCAIYTIVRIIYICIKRRVRRRFFRSIVSVRQATDAERATADFPKPWRTSLQDGFVNTEIFVGFCCSAEVAF